MKNTVKPEQTEEKAKGLSGGSSFAVCLRHLYGVRRFFAVAIVSSLLGTMLSAVAPQLFRLAVDAVTGERSETMPAAVTEITDRIYNNEGLTRLLLYAAGGIVICALLSGVCTYLFRVGTSRGAEGFAKSLRDGLFIHIERLPLSFFSVNQTGDLIQRCTSDTDVIRTFVAEQLTEVFRMVFLTGVSLYVMFTMSVPLSFVAAAFIPIVLAYSMIFYRRIATRFREADEAEGDLTADVQENLTGVRVVRAFGRERYEMDKFDKKNNFFAMLWVRLGKTLSLFWGIGDFASSMQVLFILIGGVYLSATGKMTLGTLVAFITYNANLVWPIRNLGRVLSEMSKSGVSFERIAYILNSPEESYGGDKTPDMKGDIVFDHVSFGYDGTPVLSDVSFTLPAGHSLGILGATGSGKSTVCELLLRLYSPTSGRITVSGVDIEEIPLEHLRRNIALVAQEPFLFSRTVGENIRAAAPAAETSEIRAAARDAHIDREIVSFEKGYDTVVGERGVTLSGGQKQRVSMARALMTGAPAIIFDDSLSAVDATTDAAIRASLRERTGGVTSILISHRITTLRSCDEIIVLENGRITERGSHEELIAREGMYKSVYEIQKG